jgi:uncharacterized membrane protein
MEKALAIFFVFIFIFSFIFIILLPVLGLYIGFTAQIIDEKKYNIEGARYLDGK